MKSIKITVTGSDACVTEKPVLTSGTVGLPVEFTFDAAWDGLGKTAVFRAGSRSYPVSCVQSTAVVPWEVLEKSGVGLYIGVFGADGEGTVKIPTVWAFVDTIVPGTQIPETVPKEPAGTVYDQILAAANEAVEMVNDLREDADSGKFIGPPGPKGDAGVVEFIVVAELPTQNIKNAIYLLPTEGTDGNNLFAEYIYVDDAWERIGSASVQVDLSDYAKANEVVKQIAYDRNYKPTGGSDGTYYGVVYGRKFDNTESVFAVAGQNVLYTIPIRDYSGNFYLGTPILPYHAATKGYVDGLIEELTVKIAELEAKLTGE